MPLSGAAVAGGPRKPALHLSGAHHCLQDGSWALQRHSVTLSSTSQGFAQGMQGAAHRLPRRAQGVRGA